MKLLPTAVNGVVVVETSSVMDARGAFTRLFCERDLSAVIGQRRIAQINHSYTAAAGAIRGLHYQRPPHAEMKFIHCLKGRVFDVAVDLRAGSPSYLKWHSEEISDKNLRMVVVPEGCAHGFQTLEPNSELLYLHTTSYAADAEGGIRFDDPLLGIAWPLKATDVSRRDSLLPTLDRGFRGIAL